MIVVWTFLAFEHNSFALIQGDSGILGPVGFTGQTGRKVNPPDYIISLLPTSHGWTMIPSDDAGESGPRNVSEDCMFL